MAEALSCLEGGQFHRREQVRSLSDLLLGSFSSYRAHPKSVCSKRGNDRATSGQARCARRCGYRPVAAGIQRHGLVSDSTDSLTTERLEFCLEGYFGRGSQAVDH